MWFVLFLVFIRGEVFVGVEVVFVGELLLLFFMLVVVVIIIIGGVDGFFDGVVVGGELMNEVDDVEFKEVELVWL